MTVRLDRDGAIATIVIDRPQRHNALDRPALAAFGRCVDALEADPATVVLVRGAGGRAFGSGGDLQDFATVITREQTAAMRDPIADTLHRLSALDAISIACIDGLCVGGAIEVAVHCDLRIASAGAEFRFSQGRIGVVTGWGGGVRLVDLVGRARALEWLALRATVDAETAARAGLVNRVVAEDAAAEGKRWAERISTNVGNAPAGMKRVVASAAEATAQVARAVERDTLLDLWTETAHHDAVARLLAKLAEKRR